MGEVGRGEVGINFLFWEGVGIWKKSSWEGKIIRYLWLHIEKFLIY